MTRVDIDRWCTTPGRLAREHGAVHPVILVESSGTFVDGVQVDDEQSFTGLHHGQSRRPSPVRAVEGNLSGLSRRLKAAANVLDAAVPPQRDWRTRSAVQPIPMSSVA